MSAHFDWERALGELGVEYVTSGKNVGHGEINIRCPWCGANDPSFHLGINPKKSAWRCWRNKAHAGKSITYLLNRLVGFARASALLERYGLAGSQQTYARGPQSILGDGEAAPTRPFTFTMPTGVYPFDRKFDFATARYLAYRGFNARHVATVAADFCLHVGRHGQYAGRLVIPYIERGQIVHFTARAIAATKLRFKASPVDEAVIDPKELIYNADALDNPAGVILVEGPLDAIKTTFYAPLPGVALSTNSVSKEQLQRLKRAKRVIIMLDNDEVKNSAVGNVSTAALSLYADLMRAGVAAMVQPVPRGYKDLAEIPWNVFPRLITVETLLT